MWCTWEQSTIATRHGMCTATINKFRLKKNWNCSVQFIKVLEPPPSPFSMKLSLGVVLSTVTYRRNER